MRRWFSSGSALDYRFLKRVESGRFGEPSFSIQLTNPQGNSVSPFHGINLPKLETRIASKLLFPFVCEIPRESTAKMEVQLNEKFNPIKQDYKNNGKEPRFLPIKPLFNYGMIPQTFADPLIPCSHCGLPGDGDAIDAIEVSKSTKSTHLEVGSVIPVRVLGSLCFIDNNEADWKILVSADQDDDSDGPLNEDCLMHIFHFFENYKGPNSGNYFHSNRKLFSLEDTMHLLQKANDNYNKLVHHPGSNTRTDIWLDETTA